jgi:NifU-like protein involved in Fe-S cluster formation
VASAAIVQTNINKASIDEIQKIQNENLNKIKQFEENEMKIKRVLELMQKEIDGIEDKVKTISESIKTLYRNLP